MDGTFGRSAGATATAAVPSPAPSLAQYVKGRRLAHGLSQADLAARCGVSQKSISLIESGQTVQPRLGLLDRLADALREPRTALERLVLVESSAGTGRAAALPRSSRLMAAPTHRQQEPPTSDA